MPSSNDCATLLHNYLMFSSAARVSNAPQMNLLASKKQLIPRLSRLLVRGFLLHMCHGLLVLPSIQHVFFLLLHPIVDLSSSVSVRLIVNGNERTSYGIRHNFISI